MDAGYYSSEINIIRDACSLNDICGWYRQGQILWESGNTVETVVLLSKGEIDSKKVRVEFSPEDREASDFQQEATFLHLAQVNGIEFFGKRSLCGET